MSELLEQLAQDWGYETVDDLIGAYVHDSVVPGMCVRDGCGYSTDVEPDQTRGYCEICEANTVQSCLVLYGII